MNWKNFTIGIITSLAVIVFIYTLVHATVFSKDSQIKVTELTPKTEQNSEESIGLPTRLQIPKIQVDAYVQQVGITENGNMATPHNFVDVGWYKYGTTPGLLGSAVIAGHVDNGLSLPGIFKKLDQLKEGDDIYVLTDKGNKLHFVVTNTDIYGYKTAPVDLIFNQTGEKRLRLITCTGTWIPTEKTNDKRLVVTAVLK